MFVVPCAASVPLLAETVSHASASPSDQARLSAPEFVSVTLQFVGVNGPPTRPLDDKLVGDTTPKLSGMVSALMRLVPVGVPQPVQRSKPGTAKKFDGLLDRKSVV